MNETKLIEAAKSGDIRALRSLLAGGAEVNEQDEQGWTPLNWAAGRGDAEAVEVLVAHGADLAARGRDRRTPLMIAKAAGRQEVVAMLTEAEKKAEIWIDPRRTRPYCRAYYLEDLRRFPAFAERGGAEASEREVVYLHQDFTVTRSMWHGENVIFESRDPEWEAFCGGELGFAIPDDLL